MSKSAQVNPDSVALNPGAAAAAAAGNSGQTGQAGQEGQGAHSAKVWRGGEAASRSALEAEDQPLAGPTPSIVATDACTSPVEFTYVIGRFV